MKAYLIANLTVVNPERFGEYRAQVSPMIEKFGGRYLVRGGALDRVEGGEGFERLVVIEFPSKEAARRFYDSAEYAPLIRLRQEAARGDVVLVEGV